MTTNRSRTNRRTSTNGTNGRLQRINARVGQYGRRASTTVKRAGTNLVERLDTVSERLDWSASLARRAGDALEDLARSLRQFASQASSGPSGRNQGARGRAPTSRRGGSQRRTETTTNV